ncbi:hypothetical protein Ahy_A09g044357 isoform B [Arachis hypogaea]|uniref:Uncharacterized protein n=1 Tax=Arachis hypogaea TaxID=3818 RepID=A0A445BJY3_ARAHY|nr:hypothetical protein Ahy_A09g044357 isoform B [Arachis hypogaea]
MLESLNLCILSRSPSSRSPFRNPVTIEETLQNSPSRRNPLATETLSLITNRRSSSPSSLSPRRPHHPHLCASHLTLISALYTELNENFFFDSSPIHATCTNSRAFSFDSSPLLISSSRVFTFDLSSLISSSPLPFITALTNIKVSNEAKHRSLTSEYSASISVVLSDSTSAS